MTCGDRYSAVKVNCPARKYLYKSGTNGTTERDHFLSPDYHYNGKGNKNSKLYFRNAEGDRLHKAYV